MIKKRKIIYVSGSRADYGLMKETLKEINNNKKLSLKIVVCGMHLLKQFGESFNEIKKDNFDMIKLKSTFKDDSKESSAKFLSDLSFELTKTLQKEKPDIVVLLGDRAEMLSAATIATYLGIPIAHIHGGDISSTVDEPVRHAITKLAHIHFPATNKSALRIKKMGEEPKRIHVVGAPGLDSILNMKLISKEVLFKKLNLNNEDTFLLIYHPVTHELNTLEKDTDRILSTLKKLGTQTVIIYPNADAGGRKIIKRINKYNYVKSFKIFRNLPHEEFINLMKYAKIFIGNSSSGIIEAASFKLPGINIGSRQKGRERNNNIIDITCSEKELLNAIKKASLKEFRKKIKDNLYGDGNTCKKISNILSQIKIDKELINKRMSY
jgi:GDP/UDP-N,N'-diacetylbacillosamine 2-epimerase (hydrolysing)